MHRLRRAFPGLVLAFLCASFALAADVSGKWRAEFTTPDGTQRVNTFAFKAEGEKAEGEGGHHDH